MHTLGASASAPLDALLARRVALDAEPNLLQAALLEQALGHVAVLDVAQEATKRRARDRCVHSVHTVITQLLRELLFLTSHVRRGCAGPGLRNGKEIASLELDEPRKLVEFTRSSGQKEIAAWVVQLNFQLV